MKKLLCLILSVASVCALLVSCDDDILSQADDALVEFNYDVIAEEEFVTVDFYIIGGEESSVEANHTVSTRLNENFKSEYNTGVQMHYISAEEYKSTVLDAHAEVTPGKVSVVLVNSQDLYNSLKEQGVLCDLAPLYNSSSYNYGTLKKQLSDLLPLTMTVEKESVPILDDDGKPITGENGEPLVEVKDVEKYYCVPNNHVYGQYTYTLVNKALALEYNIFVNEKQGGYESEILDSSATLANLFNANCTDAAKRAAFIQKEVKGYYGDIISASDEYWITEVSAPVPDLDDVYSSAFVVAGDKALAERAMRVIYAINTQASYRNLLQYGVLGANYTQKVVDGVNYVYPEYLKKDGSSNAFYVMSLKFTGDIDLAYNCENLCVLCTETETCPDHIYWTHDNVATCSTWVEYDLNGGNWVEENFVPVYGMSTGAILLENYVPVKASEVTEKDGKRYETKYEFAGWYSHKAMTDTYRIKEIKSDMGVVRLYAKWTQTEIVTDIPAAD
ncbi:MAG: hypothetical protein IKB38_02515 [Clostridia bacterium]|nr:hypothetical protein [Clostridia bacterium]